MFLLDTSGGVGVPERMESSSDGGGGSGTPPQKKTVYRISLTLVKRESLDEEQPCQLRREGLVEPQHGGAAAGGGGGGLLEQLQEVEDESDERSLAATAAASRGHMRNFRTFSTGQLELGRLKVSRKLLLLQEKKAEGAHGGGVKEDTPSTEAAMVQNGGAAKRRFLKAKSVEEATLDPQPKVTHSKSNGKVAVVTETETPPPKRTASLLRRSFSFRHWSGGSSGELLRLRALAKDRHHSSSGCIEALQDAKPEAPPAPPSPLVVAPPTRTNNVPAATRQKSRTLETGAVLLRKTDSLSELSRKTRTLDNSDLQRLDGGGGAGGFLLRGSGGRSSERRLVRFFSGIFSPRGGGAQATGSPGLEQRPLQHGTRRVLSQSSCESVDGSTAQGKATRTATSPARTHGVQGKLLVWQREGVRSRQQGDVWLWSHCLSFISFLSSLSGIVGIHKISLKTHTERPT